MLWPERIVLLLKPCILNYCNFNVVTICMVLTDFSMKLILGHLKIERQNFPLCCENSQKICDKKSDWKISGERKR